METVLMYLLKMFICSTVLYGYYRVALYNERFHQWNRFYLLAAMVLSVVVPFISIPVANTNESNLAKVIAFMPWNAGVSIPANQSITWQDVVLLSAALVSVIFFVKIIVNIAGILMAYKSNPVSSLQHNVQLIITKLSQAPFSFFNWLFWRHDIDPATANGQRMLNHELTHIREYHSIDKLFTSLLLCVFWMNPFFWLMRRELSMIHEFLADRKAIGRQDGAAFAEMILQALPLSTPVHNGLINPFFSSQIKRRLLMITTSKEPKYNYLRRISGLILMTCSVLTLALSIQYAEAQKSVSKITIKKAPSDFKEDTLRIKPSNKMTITTSDGSIYLVADTIILESRKDGDVAIVGTGKVKAKEDGETDSKMTFKMNVDRSSMFPDKNAPLYILDGKEITSAEMSDLDPNRIKSLNVLKNESAITLYGERGKNGVIQIALKTKEEQSDTTGTNVVRKKEFTKVIVDQAGKVKISPLFYVDGTAITEQEMQNIKPNDIESINVIKGDNAIKKYGAKGKDGVVEITMKKPVT